MNREYNRNITLNNLDRLQYPTKYPWIVHVGWTMQGHYRIPVGKLPARRMARDRDIARIAPEVKMIAISGWNPHSEDDMLAATIDLYVSRRLVKPFTPPELLAAVRDANGRIR